MPITNFNSIEFKGTDGSVSRAVLSHANMLQEKPGQAVKLTKGWSRSKGKNAKASGLFKDSPPFKTKADLLSAIKNAGLPSPLIAKENSAKGATDVKSKVTPKPTVEQKVKVADPPVKTMFSEVVISGFITVIGQGKTKKSASIVPVVTEGGEVSRVETLDPEKRNAIDADASSSGFCGAFVDTKDAQKLAESMNDETAMNTVLESVSIQASHLADAVLGKLLSEKPEIEEKFSRFVKGFFYPTSDMESSDYLLDTLTTMKALRKTLLAEHVNKPDATAVSGNQKITEEWYLMDDEDDESKPETVQGLADRISDFPEDFIERVARAFIDAILPEKGNLVHLQYPDASQLEKAFSSRGLVQKILLAHEGLLAVKNSAKNVGGMTTGLAVSHVFPKPFTSLKNHITPVDFGISGTVDQMEEIEHLAHLILESRDSIHRRIFDQLANKIKSMILERFAKCRILYVPTLMSGKRFESKESAQFVRAALDPQGECLVSSSKVLAKKQEQLPKAEILDKILRSVEDGMTKPSSNKAKKSLIRYMITPKKLDCTTQAVPLPGMAMNLEAVLECMGAALPAQVENRIEIDPQFEGEAILDCMETRFPMHKVEDGIKIDPPFEGAILIAKNEVFYTFADTSKYQESLVGRIKITGYDESWTWSLREQSDAEDIKERLKTEQNEIFNLLINIDDPHGKSCSDELPDFGNPHLIKYGFKTRILKR